MTSNGFKKDEIKEEYGVLILKGRQQKGVMLLNLASKFNSLIIVLDDSINPAVMGKNTYTVNNFNFTSDKDINEVALLIQENIRNNDCDFLGIYTNKNESEIAKLKIALEKDIRVRGGVITCR